MPCEICGKTIRILNGPSEYLFYNPSTLVHRRCHEELLNKQDVAIVVGEEAIV